MAKSLFITFINVATGKICPTKPTNSTKGIIYKDNGFVVDYKRYKAINKELPWDKIDTLIDNGFSWQGDNYGSLEIIIKLDK